MGDETIIAALKQEGGQQIFNDAVLRRLAAIEVHAEAVDKKLEELAPISEILAEVRRILIKIASGVVAFLVLSEAARYIDISKYLG